MRGDVTEENLRSQTRRGSLWSISGTLGSQVISFAFGVALARILDPADFGLIAACLIFIEVGSTLVASSFASALVRKPEVTEIELSTSFVLQLITAGLAIATLALIAPVLTAIMDDKLVGTVLIALSASLFVLAFRGIPTVLARRAMNFKPIAVSNWLETLSFGVIAITMAISGFGVWSLVVARVLAAAIAVAQLAIAMKWRPKLAFSSAACKDVLGIAIQFAGKEMLADISRNIGYFFAGMQLGMQSLGYYSRAHYLMMLPVTRLSVAISSVLFPAFAKIQHDKSALHWSFQRATCAVSIVIFPLLAGLLVVAPTFIPFVYGSRWEPTVEPLQVLCVAGILYSVEPVAVSLINAKGFLMEDIRRQSLHLVILTVAILGFSRWGVVGVAGAVTLAALANWIMLIYLLSIRIGLSAKQYVESVLPAILSCLIMATSLNFLQDFLREYLRFGSGILLLVAVAFGGITYYVALLVMDRYLRWPLFNEAFSEIQTIINTASRPLLRTMGIKLKREG